MLRYFIHLKFTSLYILLITFDNLPLKTKVERSTNRWGSGLLSRH